MGLVLPLQRVRDDGIPGRLVHLVPRPEVLGPLGELGGARVSGGAGGPGVQQEQRGEVRPHGPDRRVVLQQLNNLQQGPGSCKT